MLLPARWGWHAIPLMRLAHAIIVPTGYLTEVFARFGLTATAIPNHVDVPTVLPPRAVQPIPRFFSNRNHEAHYNVAAILRAFGTVQAAIPAAELVIVGSGSMTGALVALSGALRLRHVRFVGAVAPEAMARFYQDADVYVNASVVDNMPLSILEAYANGIGVVTSDAGGIPWIARDGETALVVPASDEGALAAAMLRAARDYATTLRRAERARVLVAETYGWPAVRAGWERAYGAAA